MAMLDVQNNHFIVQHCKICENIHYKFFPVWWASHDAPQHWMPGAIDHNRSVRAQRSGIPAKSWKNEMHWYIVFWNFQVRHTCCVSTVI
jgi:hypothetical protein